MANAYNCIDVSAHEGYISWDEAKADSVDYAFIKCGFGQDYESQDDKLFHYNMDEALKAGVKVGIYFYSYATTVEQAIGEAEHCCRLIEPYKDKISFPIFYDVEEKKIKDHISETIPAFISYLNNRGFNCGVYCSTSWFDELFKDIDCDYFWFASWGPDDGEPHTKPQWADIWQYTSKGSVNGVGSGCVDCDILYNTEMQLLIIPPAPIEKTVNVDILIDAPEDIQVNVHVHRPSDH